MALRADHVALRPQGLAELIGEVEAGRVSSTNAKTVLAAAFESGQSPRELIERAGPGTGVATRVPSAARSTASWPSSRRRSRSIGRGRFSCSDSWWAR